MVIMDKSKKNHETTCMFDRKILANVTGFTYLGIKINSSGSTKPIFVPSWYQSKTSNHMFIISQLWLTSYPRSTVVQLDKLNYFPAIAFDLFSSMARVLGL